MPSTFNQNRSSASVPRYLRITGLLIIIAMVTINIVFHDLRNLFWMCNISTLLAGTALLFGMPYLALVGAAWMILGLVCWFLNVLINNMFGETISYFTHFSFTATAVFIFFRLPIRQYLWLGCFFWYLLTQLLSRFFTNPADNVNLAFCIWPGWNLYFANYFYFWCFITMSCLTILFVMNKIIYKFQKARRFNQ